MAAVGEYKPGRVTATVTDFTVPATGLAIQIQRQYDSLQKNQVGEFGYGWKLGIQSLNFAASATGDVTFTVGGRRRTFYVPGPGSIVYTTNSYAVARGMEQLVLAGILDAGGTVLNKLAPIAACPRASKYIQCALRALGDSVK